MVDMQQLVFQPRKRIVIGLMGLGVALASTIAFTVWYLVFERPDFISKALVYLVAGLLLLLIPVAGFGLLGIVLSITSDKAFPGLRNFMHWAIEFLLPLALLLGKVFGIDKDKIESSFIEVNNRLVKVKHLKVEPERILILIPHCVQKATCRYKVTIDLANCHKCGLCAIGDLRSMEERYGVRLCIATGGTQARRTVERVRPRAIIAVACERELAAGIQDVGTLPVLAIPLEKPEGPCYNTRIDPAKVRGTIEDFLKGEERKCS